MTDRARQYFERRAVIRDYRLPRVFHPVRRPWLLAAILFVVGKL